MTREEIITALRCCAKGLLSECPNCKMYDEANFIVKLKTAAADLIENQQRHIEALMKANDSLKDAIARRDKQIAVRCRECKQGEVDDPDFPDQYYCHAGCGWNNGDFYCAYGEREEGADNG